MVRVLVVEDSKILRNVLLYILNADDGIEVIGAVCDGREALEFVKKEKPDVVTMDIVMPRMDGLECTRRLMESTPVPIVVISSSWSAAETEKSFLAMQAGALAVLEKPTSPFHPRYEELKDQIVKTVKAMAEVRVIRRWGKKTLSKSTGVRKQKRSVKLIAIGASTGGPPTIRTILSGLPKRFATPVLVVQHIAEGFLPSFAEWVGTHSPLKTVIASDGEQIKGGFCYFAPSNCQLAVSADLNIKMSLDKDYQGIAPSVSHLFKSLAENVGPGAIGVLLTGMGKDGAAELKMMKNAGALTIIQDEESAVIYGMPGEALRLNAQNHIMNPEEIAGLLAGFQIDEPEKR